MDPTTAKPVGRRLELRLGSDLGSKLTKLAKLKEITRTEVVKRALRFYRHAVLASSKGAKVLIEEDGVQKELVD